MLLQGVQLLDAAPSPVAAAAAAAVTARVLLNAAELARAPDGGILVGANLQSLSTPGVFAAGDCCTYVVWWQLHCCVVRVVLCVCCLVACAAQTHSC